MEHRLNCLKNFGIVDQEHVVWVGGNAKMNEFRQPWDCATCIIWTGR